MPGQTRLTREQSRAQTRARLLDAAAEVFAQRGFYGASVEEIAERAGFSKGAFYSNFDTKEDLFLALLDGRVQADVRRLEALSQSTSPTALVEFVAGRSRRSPHEEMWTILTAEFWLHALRNRHLVPKLAERQRAARQALARVIEAASAAAHVPLWAPPEDLASLMLAVDDGLVIQESLDPDAVPADLRVRSLLLFVQAAERQPPAAGPG